MILIKIRSMKLNQLTPTTIACVTIFHLVALWLLATFISTPKLTAPSFASIEFVDIPSLSGNNLAEAQSGAAAAMSHEEKPKPAKSKPVTQQTKPVVTPTQKITATKAEAAKADVVTQEAPAKETKNTPIENTNKAENTAKSAENKDSAASKGSNANGTNAANTGASGQGSGQSSTLASHEGGHLNNPKPTYPERSIENEEEGSVKMSVRVEPNGRPSNVSIAKSSGFPRLDNAAREAVSQWRFRPATRNGEPITSIYVFPVNFSLKARR